MTVATTNFNVSPYYDDYDEDKGFLKVLCGEKLNKIFS